MTTAATVLTTAAVYAMDQTDRPLRATVPVWAGNVNVTLPSRVQWKSASSGSAAYSRQRVATCMPGQGS